jgi:hypothetical protein
LSPISAATAATRNSRSRRDPRLIPISATARSLPASSTTPRATTGPNAPTNTLVSPTMEKPALTVAIASAIKMVIQSRFAGA